MPEALVTIAVAVVVHEGHVLVGRRSLHAAAAPGLDEFPGGKLEVHETVDQALRRELQEELGITIGPTHPWRVELMDYPHARVRLHFCKVFQWVGELQMREQQAMSWQVLPVTVHPILPGTVPVLDWLAAERNPGGHA
jgi:8-oxo-dGTP diphosphatase